MCTNAGSKEINQQATVPGFLWFHEETIANKSPQCPEKDTRPRDQWTIRRAGQHLQAEADGDDDGSIASHATSGTNRSFQNKGWSGLQVNLMNHEDNQSMRESITHNIKSVL